MQELLICLFSTSNNKSKSFFSSLMFPTSTPKNLENVESNTTIRFLENGLRINSGDECQKRAYTLTQILLVIMFSKFIIRCDFLLIISMLKDINPIKYLCYTVEFLQETCCKTNGCNADGLYNAGIIFRTSSVVVTILNMVVIYLLNHQY